MSGERPPCPSPLTSRFERPAATSLEFVIHHGGYEGARKAVLELGPTAVVESVRRARLRGRGGSGTPTAQKWDAIAGAAEGDRYLVLNASEAEPGSFKDRLLLQRDPHRVIEGAVIAALAVGAGTAIVAIRPEHADLERILEKALDEAHAHGFLGDSVLGSGVRIEIIMRRGAGGYVCGEETALLASIEGARGCPRPRAPGCLRLFDCPVVVHNTETIANLPHLIEEGPERFRSVGWESCPGTKLLSMSGHVKRPGVLEVPTGSSLRAAIQDLAGGMAKGRGLKAVLPGGYSRGVLTAKEIDAPVDLDAPEGAERLPGAGATIVLDETTDMAAVLQSVLRFFAGECCGQCPHCREGTAWLRALAGRIAERTARADDLDTLLELCEAISGKGLCSLADAAAFTAGSIARKFPGELFPPRLVAIPSAPPPRGGS